MPWNPTRVLQRVGRVNRLGSRFSDVYIFNFFPTSQSDAHLGLEQNITNKLQMFHYIMGEDARYLTNGEEIGTQELFNTLNSKKASLGEEEEGVSELKYLEMLRTLRDHDPAQFEKIKKLPKKARSGMTKDDISENSLVTFFRLGKLKKFYHNRRGKSEEINFFEAVELLECAPAMPRARVPFNYFELLNVNKARFELDATPGQEPTKPGGGGRSNAAFLERILKDKTFRTYRKFTESDEVFLDAVRQQLAEGRVAKKTAQVVKKAVDKSVHEQGMLDPMKVLYILQKNIRSTSSTETDTNPAYQKREVIVP